MPDKNPIDIAGSTAQARAKKPWSAPRIQDAPVASTTMGKAAMAYEAYFSKNGS